MFQKCTSANLNISFVFTHQDYTAHQFQGIIRNVVLNGEWTSLHAGRTNGLSEVVDCDSGRAKEYKAFIISQYKLLNNPGNAMLYQ